jgi:protein-S-isoprenylcysteine O-methyltransferase Ste14
MRVIVLQIIGWVAFVVGTLAAGTWLRRYPSKETAERTSRVVHGLFFAGLVIPNGLGAFHPGLSNYDRLLGVPRLPVGKTGRLAGGALVLVGLYLVFVANVALRRFGHGANAFRLTKRLVAADVYRRSRNPMSLGYYLSSVGAGLLFGSTTVTLAALLAVVPAHLLALTYFEELELELRLGQDYLDYKSTVPFLLPRLGQGLESEAA